MRIKHWSWAYVLHILNNEAASITFDELFRESVRYSQGDITTQVFLSILQNELLQDELVNFLKQFAQKLIAKGDAIQLHKVKNLRLTVSSSVMESSELGFELESFTRGDYERVLQVCTTPDSSGEPPHLTAYLTVLLDDTDVSERLPTGCSDGEDHPTNSPADNYPPSSCGAESISKVQDWLSRSDTSSSSPGTESDCQNQRVPNKRKSVFKQRQGNATLRGISSSESDSEQVGRHGFSNPTRSFPTVAGTSETLFNNLPSRANTIHGETVESTNELLPPGDPSNVQPKQTESPTSLSTELPEGRSSMSSSEDGMTSLEADDSSDGGSEEVLSKAKRSTKRTCKKTIPAVQQCHPITTGAKKSSNLSVYQRSGYSGDDSDHKNARSRRKSSKFTSAQRRARIRRKERFNKESSSECSGAETEDYSALIRKGTDQEPTSVVSGGIKLTFQGTSCTLQIINCLLLITGSIAPDSKSTELHHAVRHQCFPSVRDILASDGGEDQIQMLDEEGHTPLEIASHNKDLTIFELLLESLICSQVSPSVTLPPCSGHQLMALLASIVKVLSKKEIDIDDSTLYWTMESCHSQLLIDELLYRGRTKKRFQPIASL